MLSTYLPISLALSLALPLARGAQDAIPDGQTDGQTDRQANGQVGGQRASQPQQEAPAAPRLVVLISVDQLIPEQLARLGPYMEGGFGRLLAEGAVFENAELPYARTETGAGHATLSTGCLPRSHGIVGNDFWDRATGKRTYCVEDAEAALVTGSGVFKGTGQCSPRTILRPTLGEILQRLDPEAKVASVSGKDRAAIGMCGSSEGLALWWDKSKGAGFVTSTAYGTSLPAVVIDFNETWTSKFTAEPWTDSSPLDKVDGDHSKWGTGPDDRPGETPLGASGITFPYEVPEGLKPNQLARYAYATPAVDGYVGIMGTSLVDAMGLGADEHTDLLALSFSGCDVVGHSNGPYSREVTDLLFRLDRSLGSLFESLDKSVGEGRWVAALTADHGVLPLPEHLDLDSAVSRRVSGKEMSGLRKALRQRMEERLGAKIKERSGPGGFLIDSKSLEGTDIEPEEARRTMATILRELRSEFPWVDDAYSYDEIAGFGPDQMGVRRALYNSFHPDRTIDVVMIQAPGVLLGRLRGTTHGSPHPYDRRIPLIFYGPGFEAGRDFRIVGSQDIVPSLLGGGGLRTDLNEDGAFDGRDLFPE